MLMDDAHLVVIHPPEFDLSVIRSTDNERHGGMEVSPVDSPVVTLQHMLHYSISLAKQVRGVGVLLDMVL